MELIGVCIMTGDAPGLAGFYETALRESPCVDGQHYAFEKAQLAVYNPGGVNAAAAKNMPLMFYVSDLMAEYDRLMKEILGIRITSPPKRRPWGAFSFWFLDPDGNTISFVEKSGGGG